MHPFTHNRSFISILLIFFLHVAYAQIPQNNLSIWLKADIDLHRETTFCQTPPMQTGNPTYCWIDQSKNQLEFRRIGDATPTYRLFEGDTLNGFPALYFNGTGGLGTAPSDSLRFTEMTAFLVGSNTGVGITVTRPGTWNNSFRLDADMVMHHSTAGKWAALQHHVDWSDMPFLVTTGVMGSGVTDLALYINGLESSASQFRDCCASAFTEVERSAYVGQRGNGSDPKSGEIAEIIVYGGVKLDQARRTIIENYLSSKYNIPIIADANFYEGDTAEKGEYDFNVTGIGAEVDGKLSESQSASLIVQERKTTLEIGEYLLVGHPRGENGIIDKDVPKEIAERFSRVWYLDKTGTVDAALIFDFSATDFNASPFQDDRYALLHSSDGMSFSIHTANATISGHQVRFDLDNQDLPNGYYTLGADGSLLGDLVATKSPLHNKTFTVSAIAPNPVQGKAYFSIDSPYAQLLKIYLYDAFGRRVKVLYEGKIGHGLEIEVDGGGLGSGVYFLEVVGEEFGVVRRVVIE